MNAAIVASVALLLAAGAGSDTLAVAAPARSSADSGANVESLSIQPARFRAAGSGASIATATGARVTYAVPVRVTVHFTVLRRTVRRASSEYCKKRAQDTPDSAGKPCPVYLKVKGSFDHDGKAGTNEFGFTGRVGGHRLRSGAYKLVAAAEGASTNQLAPFRIVG